MGEIENRLADLSPARRQLVQELLKARPTMSSERAPAASAATDACPERPSEGVDPKRACREFFDGINRSLDSTEFGQFSLFLNFGYVADDQPQGASVALPDQIFNRNSVKLVLELIGRCPIDNRRILDLGCGRGGTASVVRQFFKPRQFVGLDLSRRAVAFCARSKLPGMTFIQGDAENLPLRNASADVVINIESSQSYPNIRNFFKEVFRVLEHGGDFLYTDVLPVQQASDWTGLLKAVGFHVHDDRDITSNVLLSCDEVARNRMRAYQRSGSDAVMNNFLGTPGSHVYEEMKSGRWTYRIMHLRKPAP